MSGPIDIAVGAIATCLGRPRAIEEAPSWCLEPAVRDRLLANGHERYTEADDLAALIDGSVEHTLAAAALAPGAVDRILLVSESLAIGATKAELEDGRAVIHAKFHRMGLGRAPVTALTYSGCNGTVEALHLAKLLVAAGHATNVLVVAVDGVTHGVSRELPPAVAVASDGVATALVSEAGRPSDVAVLGDYWSSGFLEVATFRDRGVDFAATLITLGRALGAIRAQLPPRNGSDVLVCNNYGLSTIAMFSKVLGFEPGAAFVGNLPRHAHIGNVDILSNVAGALRDRPAAGGVYALGTAHTALSIVRMDPSPSRAA